MNTNTFVVDVFFNEKLIRRFKTQYLHEAQEQAEAYFTGRDNVTHYRISFQDLRGGQMILTAVPPTAKAVDV